MMNTHAPRLYGMLAEFETADALIEACKAAHREGYRKMDAFTPYPIHEVSEAIGFHKNALPKIVLIGGIVGCLAGIGLQYWVSAVAYPLNVGGRPYFSLPSFIPVTFELTILFAALSAVLGMLALNGLPMPYHPIFAVPEFSRATTDRFFLCIEATDPRFDEAATKSFLASFSPLSLSEVES